MDIIEELEKNVKLKIKDMMLEIYQRNDTDENAEIYSNGKIEGLEDALHEFLKEIERVKEMSENNKRLNKSPDQEELNAED